MEDNRLKITGLKAQKKDPNRVSIFLNNIFWVGVTTDQVLKFELFVGKELEAADKSKIEQAAASQKLYQKCLNLIASRPRSTQEIEQKLLYSYKASKMETAQIITKLKKNSWLDDEKFAEWFVEGRLMSKKLKGKHKLSGELAQKGISRSIVKQTLGKFKDQLESDVQDGKIEKFIEKELKKLERKLDDDFEIRQKLIQKLVQKGLSFQKAKAFVVRCF